MQIGYMPMPGDFRYKSVFLQGRPRHLPWDSFDLRHPRMDPGKRAKIFSPFDALRGFGGMVAAKNVLYVDRVEPDEGEKEELNRRLCVLARLTRNSRAARENRPEVSVTYFLPCEDPDSPAFGARGRYVTVSGVCGRVSRREILLDGASIPLEDVVAVEAERLFDLPPEDAEC